jgi:sugar phosphate isomerase/epimerase
MRDFHQERMKIGLVHFMAFPETMKGGGPYLETLEQVAEDDFFSAVEIRPPAAPGLEEQIKSLAEAAHLTLGAAAQPVILTEKLDPNSLDEAVRVKAVEELKKTVDFAYGIGARLAVVMSGPDPGPQARPKAKDALVKSLVELCKYAEKQAKEHVVTVSLETFDRDVDKKSLIGPSAEAAEVAARVKESATNFGLSLDLSHLPLLRETPADALTAVGENLIHVHAGNCVLKDPSHPGYGDLHPPFGIPGGENDVEELRHWLEALIYSGYFGRPSPTGLPVFTFEVKPMPGQSSAVAIANVKRTFMEAWAQL